MNPDLHGCSILVVEDAFLVADLIEAELSNLGCRVVGPVPHLQQGLAMASSEALDGAFLDVNLAGEQSFPIADKLAERGIPFAFLSGYGDAGIPEKYRAVPRLAKPFEPDSLAAMVRGFRGA